MVPLINLRPHPENYRTHPPDQLEHLAAAMRQHGFYKNIVIARDGTILAGHGAVQAAEQAGLWELPAVRLPIDPDTPQAKKIVASDNELGRFAEVDDRALTELLREVAEDDALGLVGTGYDEMILANLLMVTRSAAEVADFDEAAEWVGLPEYEPKEQEPRLIIMFESTADRDEFCRTFTGTVSRRANTTVWSGHWPKRERPRESRFDKLGARRDR